MKTLTLTTAIALLATPALAHPEHLANAGHGHSHWLALVIFGGIATYAAMTMMRRRAARKARDASPTRS
jgi:hypothetical protein